MYKEHLHDDDDIKKICLSGCSFIKDHRQGFNAFL